MPSSATGHLYVLSGPGGVGKTTVGKRVVNQNPSLWQEISATTRVPRPGEVDGQDYYFLTQEEFQRKIQNREFLEHTQVYNDWYGTLRQPVEEHLAAGKDILLIVDIQGGLHLKDMYGGQATLIFLAPPSREKLEQRLRRRGIDTPEGIALRLQDSQEEMQLGSQYYDHVVVNDELEETVSQVERLIV
jgi:guanylate kinase